MKALISQQTKERLEGKQGTLRITKKRHKYIAQITKEVPEQIVSGSNVMGVDLGIKVPAVCVSSNGKAKFDCLFITLESPAFMHEEYQPSICLSIHLAVKPSVVILYSV